MAKDTTTAENEDSCPYLLFATTHIAIKLNGEFNTLRARCEAPYSATM